MSWDPRTVSFGSGVSIGGVPVNPSSQMPVSDPRLKVVTTVWVDFRFEGFDVSAIQLLTQAFKGVQSIVVALRVFL